MSELKSTSIADHTSELSQLVHSGRTALSIVLGVLQDVADEEPLSSTDLQDGLDAAHKLQLIFKDLAVISSHPKFER